MKVTCTKCGYTQEISAAKGTARVVGTGLLGAALLTCVAGPVAGALGGGAIAKLFCNKAAKETAKTACLPKCPKCGGYMK